MRELPAIRSTRAEIDLAAVRANARALARITGARLCPVVKADAYGHGAPAVARALEADGVARALAVSLVEEGIELRDAGVALPVLVMGPALAGGYGEIAARDLTPAITDPGDLAPLAAAARQRGKRLDVHLKIDTGMGRLGIRPDRLGAVADACRRLDSLRVAGVFTHFARAEDDDPADPASATRAQLAALSDAVRAARALGLAPDLVHAANSAAALRFPEARLDMVRCGIAVYGNGVQPAAPPDSPGGAAGARDAPHAPVLAQAMRLTTRVAQIREVPAGQAVSYGGLWRAARPSRLAVLPVGYADGLPRRATGAAQVLIGGRRCPVVGAISMDISIADVTDLGDAIAVGHEVVLLGHQAGPHGSARITAAEYARAAGITEYEVTCGVSRRVPRVYGPAEAAP